MRAQSPYSTKVLSGTLTFGNDSRLNSAWRSTKVPWKRHCEIIGFRVRFVIRAVATLEPKRLALNGDAVLYHQNAKTGTDSAPNSVPLVEFSSKDSMDVGESEKVRRMRISKANKGNTPWNKGRKHSPETLQRIRERTRLAMQNPKVKMKLLNQGHAQSKETRVKIGAGVRMGWEKRREKLTVQEKCFSEWQNLIAEASRSGCTDEDELQYDSYDIQNELLKQDWSKCVEERRIVRRQKGNRRAPKSPEQRRKIAEAIAAKWTDPLYRERVFSGFARVYGVAERKPRRKPSNSMESKRRNCPSKVKAIDADKKDRNPIERMRLKRSKTPLFKDPLASSKLEMIKNIRARRTSPETDRIEAVQRARVLIAEAEKAAEALEVAAVRSSIARASLAETRKIIAEAILSIDSIGDGLISNGESEPCLSSPSPLELTNSMERKVNGSSSVVHGLATPFDMQSSVDLVGINGHVECDKTHLPNGTLAADVVFSIGGELPSSKRAAAMTKKWVRGRLVEVAESS